MYLICIHTSSLCQFDIAFCIFSIYNMANLCRLITIAIPLLPYHTRQQRFTYTIFLHVPIINALALTSLFSIVRLVNASVFSFFATHFIHLLTFTKKIKCRQNEVFPSSIGIQNNTFCPMTLLFPHSIVSNLLCSHLKGCNTITSILKAT